MRRRGIKTGMTERVRYAVLREPGKLARDYAAAVGEDVRVVQRVLCMLGRNGRCYQSGPVIHQGHALSRRWYPVHVRDGHPLAAAWGVR